MTRVTCCQLSPVVGELTNNLRSCEDAIRSAIGDGAEIIVLPELSTSGYVFESKEEAKSLAIRADHAVFSDWASILGETLAIVVCGFCESGEDGHLYNSACVIDRNGVLAVYRKVHLWDRERLVFSPGSTLAPVLDLAVGRIGICICYDLEFPEVGRTLALGGADIILVPTNWPAVFHPTGEHPPEVGIAMATARVNKVAIACCDRAGIERGIEWTEGSVIIDENGWIVGRPSGQRCFSADLTLERSRDKSISSLNDALGDRRPGLYGRLMDAYPATANAPDLGDLRKDQVEEDRLG